METLGCSSSEKKPEIIKELNDFLKEGIEISSQSELDEFINLLNKNDYALNESLKFNDISYGVSFALKKKSPNENSFDIFSMLEESNALPFNKIGELDFNGNITHGIDKNIKYRSSDKNKISYILSINHQLSHHYSDELIEQCSDLQCQTQEEVRSLQQDISGVEISGVNHNDLQEGEEDKLGNDTLLREDDKVIDTNESKVEYREYIVQNRDTLYTVFRKVYPDEVTNYGSYLNKFTSLKNDEKFGIKDPNQEIQVLQKIYLPIK